MDRSNPVPPSEGTPKDATNPAAEPQSDGDEGTETPKPKIKTEPPRTKSGPFASPKFGSAGSGGAELEPPTKP